MCLKSIFNIHIVECFVNPRDQDLDINGGTTLEQEQWLEYTSLALQEGLEYESTKLTFSILESTRFVLEFMRT